MVVLPNYRQLPMSFHEADATEKKRALWIVCVMVIFCALTAWWFSRWLGQIDALLAGGQRELAKRQIDLVFGFAALVLSASLLSLGALALKHALEVLKSQRFPSESAKLLRRMTVHTGAAAVFRGRINIGVAAFLLIGALITFPYTLIGPMVRSLF
jgi:hypothetical protein